MAPQEATKGDARSGAAAGSGFGVTGGGVDRSAERHGEKVGCHPRHGSVRHRNDSLQDWLQEDFRGTVPRCVGRRLGGKAAKPAGHDGAGLPATRHSSPSRSGASFSPSKAQGGAHGVSRPSRKTVSDRRLHPHSCQKTQRAPRAQRLLARPPRTRCVYPSDKRPRPHASIRWCRKRPGLRCPVALSQIAPNRDEGTPAHVVAKRAHSCCVSDSPAVQASSTRA